MLFHSFAYFAFFGVTFAVYWSLRGHERRMAWLVVASLIFYAAWSLWFVLLIAFTAGADYFLACAIEAASDPARRKRLLCASLGLTLSLLVLFKYCDFLLEASSGLLALLGLPVAFPALHLILPLGISFYSFETISYVVDVYRGRIPAERNPLHYALYILFFPHLIAGPIVRPKKFLPQVRARKHFDWARLQLGWQIFLRGLFKKAVLGDRLALVIDPIFQNSSAFSPAALWLGAVGYAAQAYCDFSGYTDMALGSAHALGFKLPQNFNRPYFADSIGDFWRRWHITLSSWVRDYIYIPLGGSHGAKWQTYRNLLITMAAVGFWHGAGWTYLVFGFYHGLLLCFERAFPYPEWTRRGAAKALRIAWTFILLCLGLVVFRSESLGQAALMLRQMFRPAFGASLSLGQMLPPESLWIAFAVIAAVFAGHLIGSAMPARRWERLVPAPLLGLGLAVMFLLIQLLIPPDGKPFIYFQF